MGPGELRQWVQDALVRHDRDVAERGETPHGATAEEIIDAVWGRLPLTVRRATNRAQVQASLTLLTLRSGFGHPQPSPDAPRALRPPGPPVTPNPAGGPPRHAAGHDPS
ncbi:MAG: hypothetical protein FWD74_09045 [Actinomycetia bacterium]|nr:hypothetical protein [Actinomycetes bacterium]